MFQENEKMEYHSIKAPDELKNRTWSSIQQEKKKVAKQRKQVMYVAACFAGLIFASNAMLQSSTIVKVNNKPISYLNVNVGMESGDVPFAISEGRNKEIQGEIPMEINVSGKAQVEVSAGTIRTENDSEISEMKVTILEVQDENVVIWCVDEESSKSATCTITTEQNVYQYVLEATESGWKLRLKEKN